MFQKKQSNYSPACIHLSKKTVPFCSIQFHFLSLMMNEIFFADLKNDLVPLGRKEKKKERECHTIHQLELLLYSHFTLVLDNSGDVTMLYWSVISFFL